MRSLILSILVAGQFAIAVQPALAAELEPGEQSRLGMFGGMLLRLPMGGEARAERPSLSIGIAPTMRSQRIDGESRTRIGQGFELSFSDRRPELRLAGSRLDRLDRTVAPGDRRAGVSTLGWVGIGVGAVALILGGAYLWLDEALECDPGEC